MSFSHWTRIIDNMNYLYYEHKSSQVCMVKEDERMYHACLSTHNYLNEMCLMNGSSLKGRQEAFIYQMKTKKFIPVVVNISKHEVYFPTKSKKAHDCIWINYANIQNVMYYHSYCRISFKDGTFLDCGHPKRIRNSMHLIFRLLNKKRGFLCGYKPLLPARVSRRCFHFVQAIAFDSRQPSKGFIFLLILSPCFFLFIRLLLCF